MSERDGGLMKLVTLVGKGARLSVVPLLILIWGSSVITCLSVAYLRWGVDLSWAWSLVPIWLMLLPSAGMLFYWFALDGLSRLPETLLNSKELYGELKVRYAARKQKKEIRGLGPVATTRRMFLLGGLLWDSRDVLDAASNIYGVLDLFNPLFWLMMFISLVSTLVLCSTYILVSGTHYFFF